MIFRGFELVGVCVLSVVFMVVWCVIFLAFVDRVQILVGVSYL